MSINFHIASPRFGIMKAVGDELSKLIGTSISSTSDKEYTLKEFLAETVRINLAEFYAKKRENDVLKCLTDTEIKDMASEGKVSFQILYNDKVVSEEAAIENALQCFEDGMVAVFVDSTRIEELDCKLSLTEGCHVIFVKLTFLVGRMW